MVVVGSRDRPWEGARGAQGTYRGPLPTADLDLFPPQICDLNHELMWACHVLSRMPHLLYL